MPIHWMMQVVLERREGSMADLVGSVEKIISIALAIKEAVETVRHNKKEGVDIGRRVMRIRALLSQLLALETTTKEPAMGDTVGALEETLCRTRKLVTECQQKNMVRRFVGASDLSKQLREVKQDISDHMMDGLSAANVNSTIMLTNIQRAAAAPPGLQVLDEVLLNPGQTFIRTNIQFLVSIYRAVQENNRGNTTGQRPNNNS
ncbi:hypothetical protein PVAP13_8NG217603 [Panicum virgatum]|uniref:Mixed lineage kinase domain-containing protein n=1 Tax=Panicum virgatum TaxID=38727 RepID=A0A8T0PE79_PANVG|nr:hypothetical protein PVAP13_8NG217603 [Panicum virgatum]